MFAPPMAGAPGRSGRRRGRFRGARPANERGRSWTSTATWASCCSSTCRPASGATRRSIRSWVANSSAATDSARGFSTSAAGRRRSPRSGQYAGFRHRPVHRHAGHLQRPLHRRRQVAAHGRLGRRQRRRLLRPLSAVRRLRRRVLQRHRRAPRLLGDRRRSGLDSRKPATCGARTASRPTTCSRPGTAPRRR